MNIIGTTVNYQQESLAEVRQEVVISEKSIERFSKNKYLQQLEILIKKLIKERPLVGFEPSSLYPQFLRLIK